MTLARRLTGLLLLAFVAGALGFLVWRTTPDRPLRTTDGASASDGTRHGSQAQDPESSKSMLAPGTDKPSRVDATGATSSVLDNWWEDPDLLASIQDRIREEVVDQYASWADLDARHRKVIERIFRDTLTEDATGSDLLASLRPEDLAGLTPLEQQTIARLIGVAKRNLREFGADPFQNPRLTKTEYDILARELEETPLDYPPEYVLRSLGYQYDGPLPNDLMQEVRALWIQSLLAIAPLKAAVDIHLSAMGIVDDILGKGTKMPAASVLSPDYAAALEEYQTAGRMYRDQLRRILEARGLLR